MESMRRLQKAGAALLTVGLMAVVVVKAQGCQRPIASDVPEASEPEAEAEAGAPQTAEPKAAATDAGQPDAGGADSGGAAKPSIPDPVEREMLPATKAGPVFDVSPRPRQQNSAPE